MTSNLAIAVRLAALLAGLIAAPARSTEPPRPGPIAPQSAAEPPSAEAALARARAELAAAQEQLRRAAQKFAEARAQASPVSSRAQAARHGSGPDRGTPEGVGIAPATAPIDALRSASVFAVTPGSEAAEAGPLRSGDPIVSANGMRLSTEPALPPSERPQRAVQNIKPSDELAVTHLRDGRHHAARVHAYRSPTVVAVVDADGNCFWSDDDEDRELRVATPPIPPLSPVASVPPMPSLSPELPQLELASLDAGLAQYFGTGQGVLVVHAPASHATGLQSGDVIQKIDGQPVDEPIAALSRLAEAGAGGLRLDLLRRGKPVQVTATSGIAAAASPAMRAPQ